MYVYTYMCVYKKEWNNAIWMDLENIIAKWSQSEKQKKFHLYVAPKIWPKLIYPWNRKDLQT